MCRRSHTWRSTPLILALVVVVDAQPAVAQIQIQVGPGAGKQAQATVTEVGLNRAERTLRVNLSRAKEQLLEQRYAEAVRLLQEILDSDNQPGFAVDPQERTLMRNLRIEAERLIGSMPAAGLQSYEVFCDATARQSLEAAITRFDIEGLISTSRRYFYTDAGTEATYLLGTIYLDQGRPFDAALWLERLRQKRPMVTSGRNVLVLQTAIAWGLVGRLEMAEPALLELKQLTPQDSKLNLGDRTVEIFGDDESPVDWLSRCVLERAAGERVCTEWSMPRGDASRSSMSSTTMTRFEPQLAWQINTSRWQVPVEEAPFSGGVVDVARQIAGLETDFLKKNSVAIPCSEPLLAGDVALVRTHSALQAYDAASGQLLWEANGDDALEQVRSGVVPALPGDTGSILDPVLLDRVFENTTFGTMSASAESVFVVQDLGFVTSRLNQFTTVKRTTQKSHPLAAKPYNRLCALDTTTGEQKWSVGGEAAANKLELAGYFFLGPPLPVANSLYCLAEANRQIQLLVLDARTGRLELALPLQAVAVDVTQDEHRGLSGLSPSFADRVLICPTGSGLFVAVDLATRQLMWSYRYRELEQGSAQDRMRRMLLARNAALRGQAAPDSKQAGHWVDSLPIITGGRVFVTPRDSKELHCLRLTDGTLLWKLPKKERQYIGGVHGDRLLVVGTRQIEMFDVVDGKAVWSQPVEISTPSGRGLLVGNHYHVPLSTGAVATVDLDDAKIASVFELTDGLIPGNLISANGFIISQGAAAFACFKQSAESPGSDSQ